MCVRRNGVRAAFDETAPNAYTARAAMANLFLSYIIITTIIVIWCVVRTVVHFF